MPVPYDPLAIYKRLGKQDWKPPTTWGSDSFLYKSRVKGQILVSYASYEDEGDWIHASISRVDEMPTYADLKLMHRAVFHKGFAYQVFVPESEHYNFHEFALHLWGRLDGTSALPNFAKYHEKWTGFHAVQFKG